MQVITLHNKYTREIMGLVAPKENKHMFDIFYNSVESSWRQFNKDNDVNESGCDGDYLDDYCDYHNSVNDYIKIETVVNEFI
jgi:hypothetical protein